MNTPPRKLLVLGADAGFVERVNDALLPLSAMTLVPFVSESAGESEANEVVRRILREHPTFIMLDYQWGQSESSLDVSRASLQQIKNSLSQQSTALPPAFSILSALRGDDRETAAHDRLESVLVLFVDEPSVPFLQVALQLGVDWVWPSRTSMARLDEVVLRLEEMRQPQEGGRRPRLMIVENGPSDIETFRATLDDIFDLSFVGVEEAAAKDLSVTPQKAFEYLEAQGPFDAVIVDLALSDVAEAEARQKFGSEEASVATFLLSPTAVPDSTLRSVFTGVTIVKGILARDGRVPVMVMSNYIHSAAIMGQIHAALGERMARTTFFDKKHGGFEELRTELNARLLGRQAS